MENTRIASSPATAAPVSPTGVSSLDTQVAGLHHVTAVATDPQANLDFYTGLLGLRLVKKTVNFDDPSAYHLYYGDAAGSPGSILTFFCWPGANRGQVGSGQVSTLSFSAAPAALEYWRERLRQRSVAVERKSRFGEAVLAFTDPDGIPVEIVAVASDARAGWTGAGIPAEHALRGLHTVELSVRNSGPTESLLSGAMNHRLVRREGNRARFEAGPGGSGRFVDVIGGALAPRGFGGAGTVHHVAFRVAGDVGQLQLQTRLEADGFAPSEVRDRSYFRSIYYREPGGVLFEIATDVPGFAVDEPADRLGTGLMLPKSLEYARAEIEAGLPPLRR